MRLSAAGPVVDPSDELTGLIATLHETQQRIVELTGGTVDAVTHPSGSSYLLKEAQLELRRRETVQRQFANERSAILDALPAHIALLNTRGTIIVVNQAWRRFAGTNEFQGSHAAIGQNYIEVCEAAHGDCSEEAAKVADGIRSVLSGGAEDFTLEYPCHSPQERRWFRLMVTPVQGEPPGGCVIMHVNITERKVAEDRLERQAALLDEAQDGIILAGIGGSIEFWNKSAERIYGWSASEALGRSIRSLVIRSESGAHANAVATVMETGRWAGRLDQKTKSGTPIITETRLSLLRDVHGNPRAILGINTDITQRVALEEQYRQSQRLESVGQLTGGIAHDFNNLLTIILGNTELLFESLSEDEQLRPLAETAMSAAERGAELISRLLAFARRQPLDPKATDINQLVASMGKMLRRTSGGQIAIQLNCGSDVWNALVDAPQLESALLNLCVNAQDAMPAGGQLTIETANVDLDQNHPGQSSEITPGQYVSIAVSDTGTGMTPEVLARAFDPFFTTKDLGKGNGLGLSMVFGFIKQSEGHVKIESEVGRGTCVKLYLPRSDTVAPPLGQRIADASNPTGSEKILYVEDDEQVRDHVAAQLRSLGYRVVTANSGLNAINILERTPDVDLLFTDVIMPGGMSGRQLADMAAQLRPSLALLLTSGYNEEDIVHRGRTDQGIQLLAKPFRLGDLARKIRQVLVNSESRCQAV